MTEENKSEELPELPAAEKAILDQLMKDEKADDSTGWSQKAQCDKDHLKGRIVGKKLEPNPNLWIRSEIEWPGVTAAVADYYYQNIDKYAKNKADIKESEATARHADKSVDTLYMTFPMPLMISNRDLHVRITKHKYGDKVVWMWKSLEGKEDTKPVPKKWVRMKMLSFSFQTRGDKSFKQLDFDNVDMGGSMPKAVVNRLLGSMADYEVVAKDLAAIAKELSKE